MNFKQKPFSFGNYVPNDKSLNKKVPDNPKYKHVKPTIDTGSSISNHIEELKQRQRNFMYKKNEKFKRITVSRFIRTALADATDLANDGDNCNENDMEHRSSHSDTPDAADTSVKRSTSNAVLKGNGELDRKSAKNDADLAPKKQVKLPRYLLLDVRDADAFSQCHIITAKHYPSTMMSSAVTFESQEMKLYKNSLPMIIVYDDDEIIASRIATSLAERGYDNIFILTGGLKRALEICPRGLTTSCSLRNPVHIRKHNIFYPSRDTAKEHFSPEDIAAIQQYVETYINRENNASAASAPSCRSRRSKSSASDYRNSLGSERATTRRMTSTHRTDYSCNRPCRQQSLSRSTSTASTQTESTKSTQTEHNFIKTSQTSQLSNSKKSIDKKHLKQITNFKNKTARKAPWK